MVTCSKDQFPTQLPESKAYQWNPPPKKKPQKNYILIFKCYQTFKETMQHERETNF